MSRKFFCSPALKERVQIGGKIHQNKIKSWSLKNAPQSQKQDHLLVLKTLPQKAQDGNIAVSQQVPWSMGNTIFGASHWERGG